MASSGQVKGYIFGVTNPHHLSTTEHRVEHDWTPLALPPWQSFRSEHPLSYTEMHGTHTKGDGHSRRTRQTSTVNFATDLLQFLSFSPKTNFVYSALICQFSPSRFSEKLLVRYSIDIIRIQTTLKQSKRQQGWLFLLVGLGNVSLCTCVSLPPRVSITSCWVVRLFVSLITYEPVPARPIDHCPHPL